MQKKFKSVILLLFLYFPLFGTELVECIHLLNRTSFGVDQQQLTNCLNHDNYKDVVKDIIYRPREIKTEEIPLCASKPIKPPRKFKDLSEKERKNFRKNLNKNKMELKAWWFEKILKSNDPFLERMVLFWHNYFTSSFKKVKQPMLMYQQNQLFRKHALGNFTELLHMIVEDPAMVIYLDNRANRKGHPNENFAREILELFTLGEGNYNEKDIKEFARALTGYSVDKDFNFRFKKRVHDTSDKKFFGQIGKYNAHDIIDIILEQEATPIFVVKKLWMEFIGSTPDPVEVKRLARLFRKNNYEIKPLLQEMFLSKSFMNASNYGTMIKSPVELIIGTLRSFEYYNFDATIGVQFCKRLGQDLLDPPNVKGWPGGKNWINTHTLLIRKGFLNRLTRGDAMKHLKYDLFEASIEGGNKEDRAVEILLPLKVSITPSKKFNQTLRTILQHPLYQLK